MTTDELLLFVLEKSLLYINKKESINPLVKSMDQGPEKAYKEFKEAIEEAANSIDFEDEVED